MGACPFQVGCLPIGTEVLQLPIGADTEVRRPWAERVEERKSRVEFGGPFSEADTEDRAVVEQACQPVRERGVEQRHNELPRTEWFPAEAGGTAASSELGRLTWTDRPGGLSPRWGIRRSARTLSVPHSREAAANRSPNHSTRLSDLLGVRRGVLHAVAGGRFPHP